MQSTPKRVLFLLRRMTTHVLTGSDAGFVFEHAREMMRVIEAEHVSAKMVVIRLIYVCVCQKKVVILQSKCVNVKI